MVNIASYDVLVQVKDENNEEEEKFESYPKFIHIDNEKELKKNYMYRYVTFQVLSSLKLNNQSPKIMDTEVFCLPLLLFLSIFFLVLLLSVLSIILINKEVFIYRYERVILIQVQLLTATFFSFLQSSATWE